MPAELTNPRAWHEALKQYATTTGLAVALVNLDGRVLGTCQNPRALWSLLRGALPESEGSCPFCLVPPVPCPALAQALEQDTIVTAEDHAGLTHVVVPLSAKGRRWGALLAGQVLHTYPDALALARVARQAGLSPQRVWDLARQEVPVSQATFKVYAGLLQTLGGALLRQRWSEHLEGRLAVTHRRFGLLIEAIQNYALFTVDPGGCVTSWNAGAEHLYGYSEDQMVGRPYAGLFTAEDVERDLPSAHLRRALREGRAEAEHWWVRRDGTRFFGSHGLASLGEGEQQEFGLIVHDLTHIQEREAAMFEAQKLESIGVLAGGIAHDFNNLLTGVLGRASLMIERAAPDHPWRSGLESIVSSAQRAAGLTNQLLAYAGKGTFVIGPINLSALVAEVPELVGGFIPPQVELKLILAPDLPPILGDPSQMQQVVTNLVLNGVEAIGGAAGTVTVTTRLARRRIGEESPTACDVLLEVSDSGVGMDAATQARIFEPFFTTKALGRGLGLSAVSGIVRAHHGVLDVSSAPGAGTTFTLSVPSADAGSPKERLPTRAPIVPASGTVLVVDDDRDGSEVMREMLEHTGYSVIVAENGREAVRMLLRHREAILAVLLDMTMPVMDGHEALKRLREIRPGLPIVLMSGYSELVAAEHLAADANTGFLQKPYTLRALLGGLQTVLSPSRALPPS